MVQDYVKAHMWFNLAAVQNKEVAKLRNGLANKMTPAQIAEAQRLAREWLAKHEKKEAKSDLDSWEKAGFKRADPFAGFPEKKGLSAE